MKRLCILVCGILVCSCSAGTKNEDSGNFQMAEISIPNSKLQELMNKNFISKEEIETIVEDYAKTSEPAYSLEPPPNEQFFVCGMMLVGRLERASHFKLVEVTEESPIDGKPAKLLHFKVVE